MQHFLPKRSRSAAASSHPKTAPTQQPTKPMPPVPPASKPDPRHRFHSTRRYPFPKRQGPRPKIALDPLPQASSWSAGQEEEGAKSRHSRSTPQAASVVPPSTPFRQCVCGKYCCEHWACSNSAHTTDRCYSQKNKTKIFKRFLPLITSVKSPHGDPPPELIRPLTTWAEACQAIPGVSDWVLGIIKRGYSLQFARRPPRFSGMVPTLVQSTDAHVLHSEVMNLLAKGAVETVPPD